jgi:predicted metal-dependent hydrolase
MAKLKEAYPTLPFAYDVVRSRRKTLVIHIKGARVTVQSPLRASNDWISEFITDNVPWVLGKIRDQKTKVREALVIGDGRDVPFLGQPRRMEVLPGTARPKIELKGERLLIRVSDAGRGKLERIFNNWVLEQAKEYMVTQTIKTARRLGLGHKLTEVTFRKTRSKWGHCEDDGVIQYNPLVMLAPRAVIDYLIVHETCHLRHLDHSSRFWKAVGTICPDYKRHRDWLNANGHKLWPRRAS